MFSWRMDEPEERLDDLKPFHHFTCTASDVKQLRAITTSSQTAFHNAVVRRVRL